MPGLLLVCLWMALATDPPPADVETQLWELRSTGRWEEALPLAEHRLAWETEQGDGPDLWTARREVETYRRLLALADPDRAAMEQRLAQVDSVYGMAQQQAPAAALALAMELVDDWAPAETDFPYLASEAHYALAYAASLAGEQLDRAEAAARRDVELSRSVLPEGHPALAISLRQLGSVLHSRGKLLQAEVAVREAWQTQRAALGPDDAELANTLNTLAAILIEQGTFADAEELGRQVLQICQQGQDHLLGIPLNTLGSLRRSQGDLPQAEALFRESIDNTSRVFGENHWRLTSPLGNLADLLAQRHELDEALTVLLRALTVARPAYGEAHVAIGTLEEKLANLHFRRGEIPAADAAFARAHAIYRDALGDQHASTMGLRVYQARRLLVRGETNAAESLLRDAADTYEAARVRAASGLRRATVRIPSPYPELAAVELARDQPVRAWEFAERAQGRVLMDLLIDADRRGPDPEEREHHARLSRLEAEIKTTQRALRRDATAVDPATMPRLHEELLAAELAWARYLRDQSLGEAEAPATFVELDQLQSALAVDEALVGWLTIGQDQTEERSWGYVVRSTRDPIWVPLPSSDRPLSEVVGALRREIESVAFSSLGVSISPGLRDGIEGLRARLLAPLEPFLAGASRLLVVPSVATMAVPLELLLPDDSRAVVSYTPSAAVTTWLRQKPRGDFGGTLLVGDPPFREEHRHAMPDPPVTSGPRSGAPRNLPRLAWAREELNAVAELFPDATSLVGLAASESNLRALVASGELEDFAVIHVATHAVIDDQRPENSALILSQLDLPLRVEAGPLSDGLVTAQEVLREWDLDADLVVLSGCATAAGRASATDGFLGFAHAFFQSGARALVASLWNVDDEATSLLMTRFYGNWAHGDPPAVALHKAKAWLRTLSDERGEPRFAHPLFWAPFVLLGEG